MARRLARRAAPLLALLLAHAAAPAAAPARPALELELAARAIAPGEPLRVIAISPVPLATLDGRFLGRSLAFERADAGPAAAGRERWHAWALVDLDDPAGAAELTLEGRAADGARLHGGRAVVVEPREFPRETLEVAPRYVEPPPEVAERRRRERELLGAIYARRSPGIARRPFVAPVPGRPTSIFGARRVFNGEPRAPHPGLDLRAASGTPVRASGPGEVVLAQELYFAGNTVILDHGGGLFTLYAHLSTIEVAAGQRVDAGRRIGRSGATGRVTGPHLHWGAKVGDRPFDPRALTDAALFPDAAR